MKPVPLLLLVPLALASFGFSAMAPQQAPSVKVWRQSQKTSPGHDSTYTRFTLVGRFLKAPQGDVGDVSNRPAFVVDCVPGKGSRKSKFVTGNLLVGAALKIDYVEPQEIHGTSYYPKVAVQYRIDDAKEPEKENWTPGTEKTSASIPKDALKKILRAQAVDLTVGDDRGSEIVMKFDMPDPKPVEDACNVDDRKK
jgi:isochorismate synthase EntC